MTPTDRERERPVVEDLELRRDHETDERDQQSPRGSRSARRSGWNRSATSGTTPFGFLPSPMPMAPGSTRPMFANHSDRRRHERDAVQHQTGEERAAGRADAADDGEQQQRQALEEAEPVGADRAERRPVQRPADAGHRGRQREHEQLRRR